VLPLCPPFRVGPLWFSGDPQEAVGTHLAL
jgi:hypothetical protein